MWDQIIGQERIKNLLRTAIERGRVAHAYLFHGEAGVGMDAMAIEFARVLNCQKDGVDACGSCPSCKLFDNLQHPNLRLVFALPRGKSERSDASPLDALTDAEIRVIQEQVREKAANPYHQIQIPKANEIRINSIRELRREASLSPFAEGWKVFLLLEADRMNDEASNALLKTLEEPTHKTVVILTTSKRERLLPTILSRCQAVRFDSLTNEEIREALVARHSAPQEDAELVAVLANGSFTQALDLLDADIRGSRDTVVQFVRNALGNHPTKLFEQVEELVGELDRAGMERWLSLMLVWFRDAGALREGKQTGIVNVDQLKSLQSFVANFPTADHSRVISSVERAIALVGKNVYLPLVLANLAYQLKESIAVGPKESHVKIKAG
jgi:DNA polymerase-3 subunit delta'